MAGGGGGLVAGGGGGLVAGGGGGLVAGGGSLVVGGLVVTASGDECVTVDLLIILTVSRERELIYTIMCTAYM